MTYDFDLFVIGAGSGGVRAARVSAAYGAKVAIAEEHRVGGTCVIRGCVPKKLLVYGAHFAEDLHDARRFGWTVGSQSFDWPTLRDNVLAEVSRLEGIYGETLGNHHVEIIRERAVLTGPNTVRLASGREISAEKILIATGGWPVVPEFPGSELGITSNEVFHLETMPKRVVIAGGGYIANEFAGIFNEFGAKVTIVNRGDTILRGYDAQIRDRLLQISMTKGIEFRFNAPFESIEKQEDGSLVVKLKDCDPIHADIVLFATGRAPNVSGLGLEAAGVELNAKGAIKVDADNRTNVPGIYAVGDVTDRIQLTPVAIREGQAFADTVFGNKPTRVDYANVPTAVFSHPPIGAVGMTEAEARNKLGTVRTYTSDFRPMKNVLANRNERALYKMIVDASTVAVKAGLTKAQFDDTVALHPSMAEELVLLK
jgi:glutathione reductase (NADPH)